MLIDGPHRDTTSWASGLQGGPPGTPSPLSPRRTSAEAFPGRPYQEGRSISARSEARTYDLDGDLCAATGCPAQEDGPVRFAGAVTGQRYGPATGLRVRAS